MTSHTTSICEDGDGSTSLSLIPSRRSIRLGSLSQKSKDGQSSTSRHASPVLFASRDVNALAIVLPESKQSGRSAFGSHHVSRRCKTSDATYLPLKSSIPVERPSRHPGDEGASMLSTHSCCEPSVSSVRSYARRAVPRSANGSRSGRPPATLAGCALQEVPPKETTTLSFHHSNTTSRQPSASRLRSPPPRIATQPVDLPYITSMSFSSHDGNDDRGVTRGCGSARPYSQGDVHDKTSGGSQLYPSRSKEATSTPPPRRAFVLSRLPSNGSQTIMEMSFPQSSQPEERVDKSLRGEVCASWGELNEGRGTTPPATSISNRFSPRLEIEDLRIARELPLANETTAPCRVQHHSEQVTHEETKGRSAQLLHLPHVAHSESPAVNPDQEDRFTHRSHDERLRLHEYVPSDGGATMELLSDCGRGGSGSISPLPRPVARHGSASPAPLVASPAESRSPSVPAVSSHVTADEGTLRERHGEALGFYEGGSMGRKHNRSHQATDPMVTRVNRSWGLSQGNAEEERTGGTRASFARPHKGSMLLVGGVTPSPLRLRKRSCLEGGRHSPSKVLDLDGSTTPALRYRTEVAPVVGPTSVDATAAVDAHAPLFERQRWRRSDSLACTPAGSRVSDEVKDLVEKAQEEVRRTRESLLARLQTHKNGLFSVANDSVRRKEECDGSVSAHQQSVSDATATEVRTVGRKARALEYDSPLYTGGNGNLDVTADGLKDSHRRSFLQSDAYPMGSLSVSQSNDRVGREVLRLRLANSADDILRRLRGYDTRDHGVLAMETVLRVVCSVVCQERVPVDRSENGTPDVHSWYNPPQRTPASTLPPSPQGVTPALGTHYPRLEGGLGGGHGHSRQGGLPTQLPRSVEKDQPVLDYAVTRTSPTRTLERVLARQAAQREEEANMRVYLQVLACFQEVFGMRYALQHLGVTNASRHDAVSKAIGDTNEVQGPLESWFPRLRQQYASYDTGRLEEGYSKERGHPLESRFVPPLDVLVYYKTFVDSLRELR